MIEKTIKQQMIIQILLLLGETKEVLEFIERPVGIKRLLDEDSEFDEQDHQFGIYLTGGFNEKNLIYLKETLSNINLSNDWRIDYLCSVIFFLGLGVKLDSQSGEHYFNKASTQILGITYLFSGNSEWQNIKHSIELVEASKFSEALDKLQLSISNLSSARPLSCFSLMAQYYAELCKMRMNPENLSEYLTGFISFYLNRDDIFNGINSVYGNFNSSSELLFESSTFNCPNVDFLKYPNYFGSEFLNQGVITAPDVREYFLYLNLPAEIFENLQLIELLSKQRDIFANYIRGFCHLFGYKWSQDYIYARIILENVFDQIPELFKTIDCDDHYERLCALQNCAWVLIDLIYEHKLGVTELDKNTRPCPFGPFK